jgi:hypothetical protein
MTDDLTVQEVADSLDLIIDQMAADPNKVVTFAMDDGKRFVLISPQHYERLRQAGAPGSEASETKGDLPINE